MEIHQIKTRLVNSYVIEYPDKLLVMDVAINCHRYVLGYIETQMRRNIEDVNLVICSHDDPDHMGGVKALAKLCSAEIALPEASGIWRAKFANDPAGKINRFTTSIGELFRPRLWQMYLNKQRDQAAKAQPRFEGNPGSENDVHGKEHKRITPNYRLFHDGKLPDFDDWQVIHTPGHSWDSCCYYHSESGSLLTGDTLLGSNKHKGLVSPSIYANRKQTAQSLKKLQGLDVQAAYPGHGAIFKGKNLIPNYANRFKPAN